MAQLSIKVGASVDRSLQVAFHPLIEGAKRAKAAIESESKKAGRAISTETTKGTKDAEARFRELEAEIMTGMPRALNVGSAAVKQFARETTSNFSAVKKNFADLAREAESSLAKIDKAEKKAAGQGMGRRVFDAAGGTKGAAAGLASGGRAAMGIGKAAAGAAFGIAKSLARGVGVDTDLGSIFKKNADLEALAQNISNSGYMAGDKKNGTRVAASELMSQALQVGGETGNDANAALEGLSKFVGKTGDLKLGRELMKDLAIYAKATGTELNDMTDAAADVATALPEAADKNKQVLAVMRAISGQGKLGAVEVKDLASQMAKLASNAGQFEGSAADNIITLGAMAQESRQRGGSASASQATQSVASFVQMIKTPRRAKEFEQATGTKVYNPTTGMLRDPQKIIQEALAKVGMDPIKLKTVFQNSQGSRAIEGFATVFRQAGGGEKGMAAVDAEFKRLKDAAMSDAEIMESFARAMKTGQSQAEVFNNKLRESALQMQTALLPALVALSPLILKTAEKFSTMMTALFGEDPSKKAADDVTKGVGDAIASTNKQVAGGKVSEAQIAENQKLAKQALLEKNISAGDYEKAKKDGYSDTTKSLLKAADYLPAMALLGWIGGGGAGDSLGTAAVNTDEQDIRAKKLRAENMDKASQDMAATNKDLLAKIDAGIVVKVANLDELKNSVPGVSGDGRQPSPEEKAAGR